MTWEPGEEIFDIKALASEFAEAEAEPSMHDEEQLEKWIYLGTVFVLMPSGKYYTPYACSNVEPCEQCGGVGQVDSPMSQVIPGQARAVLHSLASRMDWMLRSLAMRFYGPAFGNEWPAAFTEVLKHTMAARMALQEKVPCKHCGGIGSREAYLDEAWCEQAEEELAKIGACLMNGESDPCDLFAVKIED